MSTRGSDDGLCAALEELPLFPLPGVIFFPHTLLPLHVFEARYRQLTEHVLATHKHLAVVHADVTRQDAPVCGVARVAGVGRIVRHERLADGRFHLLLQGVGRAELLEELPQQDLLYRRARARLLEAGCVDADAERELSALRACYARLLEARPAARDVLGDLPLRIPDAAVLADVVPAAVLVDAAARQSALEETTVAGRLKMANEALATLLLQSLGTETGRMH
jgi:Lon protease-like protein